MPWLAIATNKWTWIAIAFGVLTTWGFIQTERLELCGERLDAAVQANAALRKEIAIQNSAVDRLKAESDAKVQEAQNGLVAAQEHGQAARAEADRLRTASKRPAKPGAPAQAGAACPTSAADQAVATVRQGLK